MEIKIDISELRKKKLFIATPMYGGACAGIYTRSMCDLNKLCTQYGIELNNFFLFNESLIQRARNYCVDEFLRSDCTHLLFIDGDIGFNPNDVLVLLALMSDESPYDVLCAPYPKKTISWEKIKLAVDKGAAEKNPNELEHYVGDFVFNPVIPKGQTSTKIMLGEPTEVLESGTGFMLIRRSTFEKYEKSYPKYKYLPDHVRTEHFDGSREIMAYFDCEIDEESRRYLSEDYLFCQNVRKMGGKVWLCPWMQLVHVGTYVFGGSLAALAQIGASLTADADQLKGFRNKKDKPKKASNLRK